MIITQTCSEGNKYVVCYILLLLTKLSAGGSKTDFFSACTLVAVTLVGCEVLTSASATTVISTKAPNNE